MSSAPEEECEVALEALERDRLFNHDLTAVAFHFHQYGLAGGRGRLHGSIKHARPPGWEPGKGN